MQLLLELCEKSCHSNSGRTPWWQRGAGFVVLAFSVVTVPAQSALAETKAGVTTAVENRVLGILHGKREQLSVGSEVFMDQVVRTEDESTTQLMLLDKTNISVGTRSEVVLDRFVFDPNRPKGEVIINATRGVFRFVTGTQDHSSYRIKTPVATIGVRGTVVQFYIPDAPADGSKLKDIFQFLLESGEADVTKLDGEVLPMTMPGILLTLHADGSYDQRPWIGKISLYESHLGDVTGAFGAQGAGSAGGQTNSFRSSPFGGNNSGGNGTGGNPSSNNASNPINLLTFGGSFGSARRSVSP